MSSEDDRAEENPAWFGRLLRTLVALRHLVHKDSSGKSLVLDVLRTSLPLPSMAWNRVIVITNIPHEFSFDVVIQGVLLF